MLSHREMKVQTSHIYVPFEPPGCSFLVLFSPLLVTNIHRNFSRQLLSPHLLPMEGWLAQLLTTNDWFSEPSDLCEDQHLGDRASRATSPPQMPLATQGPVSPVLGLVFPKLSLLSEAFYCQ